MGSTIIILPPQEAYPTLNYIGMRDNGRNQLYRTGNQLTTYEWWEDSACLDKDPNLFEIQDGQSKQSQHEMIAEGLKICSTCPVAGQCMNSSTEVDRYWTTRGGRPPERLFSKEGGETPIRKAGQKYIEDDEVCKVCGHPDVRLYSRSNRRDGMTKRVCMNCNRLKAKEWRENKKASKLAS